MALLSYLYKDNIIFRVAEHVFIAVAAAHAMVMAYFNVVRTGVEPAQDGNWAMLIPLLGGFLLYTRFSPRLAWMSRYSLGFLMGVGAGVAIKGSLEASFIAQLSGAIVPLNSIDNILLVIGTFATLTYFLFMSAGRSGPMLGISRVGRWTMMLAFGAAYGNTVMYRMSLLIGRFQYLFGSWLRILPD